ncbi:MAG TPA: holo-ACP synthase [Conexibacter sp.]|jgi:holo-[acyl-carrier protein] synthase
MSVRVGIDLVTVSSVSSLLEAHGERYLARVFTPREIADSTGVVGAQPERLAARFAAKEATLKVLRVAARESVPWLAIEVRRAPEGWTTLALTGRAAALAAEAGIEDLAVSLTHEDEYASAVVIAELGPNSR